MPRDFNVVIEQDLEVNCVASFPLLPGCQTQARSLDALMDRIREAIGLCLGVQLIEGEPFNIAGLQRVIVST